MTLHGHVRVSTAGQDLAVQEQALRTAGMDGHLAKPVSPAALHAALARHAPKRA